MTKMDIDKLYWGTCPYCDKRRGSLWRDRRTGEIVAPCVVCRRKSHGPSPLTAGRGTTGQPPATGLVLDSRQPAGAACVIDISRCPTLIAVFGEKP